MRERKCNTQAGGDDSTRNHKKSRFLQLEVAEIWYHNACIKVCIQHWTWLIANGRRLRHHVCQIVILPQVCRAVTYWKHVTCRMQLRVNLAFKTAHYNWAVHRPFLQNNATTLAWHKEKDFPDFLPFSKVATASSEAGPPHCRGFTTHADTPYSLGLPWKSDKPDAENFTWQNSTPKRQTSMSPAGFEPSIPTSEKPQTNPLDRMATGIIFQMLILRNYVNSIVARNRVTYVATLMMDNSIWYWYFAMAACFGLSLDHLQANVHR